MKKSNKKMPLQTLTGQSGKYQINGEFNNTISKELRVLRWILHQTVKGIKATTFDSFTQNQDTMFTSRVSTWGSKYNLEIPRKQVKNPNTGAYYNEDWLSDDDIDKVITILNKE